MESPRPLPALTDDLLEEVFVRIGSPADLVRVSTACVAFRRLIANPSFLRRYRSLHPPILLGILYAHGILEPTEAPHPSAALAGAVARGVDLNYKAYLPSGAGGSYICDVRDGRLLLRCIPDPEEEDEYALCQLAVRDPLARPFLLLPPLPDDLLASVQAQKRDLSYLAASLVPSGDGEDDTSFRVIVRMHFAQMVVVFIFSSDTGHWSAGPSIAGTLTIPLAEMPSYAYGCFYWKVMLENKLLKLDTSSMELSVVAILYEHHYKDRVVIVEASEGRLGMFSLIHTSSRISTSLRYTIRQIGDGWFDQLIMDSVIPLPVGYFFFHIHSSYEGEGYIFIFGRGPVENTCLALEIKTLKIERVCRRSHGVFPYFGFLPFISQRMI